jgi:hypothetical protein
MGLLYLFTLYTGRLRTRIWGPLEEKEDKSYEITSKEMTDEI